MSRYKNLPSDQKISDRYVRAILRRHGHEPDLLESGPSYHTNEMWSLPEDKLRWAIYNKARKGARETIKGIR